jgi:hypothetical protein
MTLLLCLTCTSSSLKSLTVLGLLLKNQSGFDGADMSPNSVNEPLLAHTAPPQVSLLLPLRWWPCGAGSPELVPQQLVCRNEFNRSPKCGKSLLYLLPLLAFAFLLLMQEFQETPLGRNDDFIRHVEIPSDA